MRRGFTANNRAMIAAQLKCIWEANNDRKKKAILMQVAHR